MASKKTVSYTTIFFGIVLVIGVVVHIIRRNTHSGLASLVAWIGEQTEGFTASQFAPLYPSTTNNIKDLHIR